MTFIVPKGGLEESSLQGFEFAGPFGYWSDARVSLTFLHRQVGPDGPMDFCNLPWCVLGFGGIDNKGFDCALRGFLPFYLAI